MGTKICNICGEKSARYVCQECDRNVCERCLKTRRWLCAECYKRFEKEISKPEAETVFSLSQSFIKIFLLGFFLIFAGMVTLIIAALVYGLSSSLGLIVFIGPIPIIFGAGKYAFLAIVLAIILTLLGLAIFLFLRREKWMSS